MPKDFVEKYYNDHIGDIGWYYNPWTVDPKFVINLWPSENKQVDTGQFCHLFYENSMGVNSPFFKDVQKIINAIELKIGEKFSKPYRVKSNCTTQKFYEEDTVCIIHTDYDKPNTYMSMIYYIHDTDGDTVFYDNSGKITKRVSPKQNRCVVFPSELRHAGQNPRNNEIRMITNIVMVK